MLIFSFTSGKFVSCLSHEYAAFSSLKPKHRLGFLLVVDCNHQHFMGYQMKQE